jgi:vacuolar-type H+-ATPase subunit I/STV1
MALLGLLFICFGLFVYFLPTYFGRSKRNIGAIFALNLFLGWTLVGWVVALVWALSQDAPTAIVISQPVSIVPGVATLCAQCGRYSDPTSKFCQSCGYQLAAQLR